MKNKIVIFKHEEFGEIRTLNIDGEPWFVGKDIAVALGYSAPRNAIQAHVDNEDKTTALIQCTGSEYKSNAVIINESGLYSLILSSKLTSASSSVGSHPKFSPPYESTVHTSPRKPCTRP